MLLFSVATVIGILIYIFKSLDSSTELDPSKGIPNEDEITENIATEEYKTVEHKASDVNQTTVDVCMFLATLTFFGCILFVNSSVNYLFGGSIANTIEIIKLAGS